MGKTVPPMLEPQAVTPKASARRFLNQWATMARVGPKRTARGRVREKKEVSYSAESCDENRGKAHASGADADKDALGEQDLVKLGRLGGEKERDDVGDTAAGEW